MDNSTITFIGALIIAFIFLRWFISPDLPSQSSSTASNPNSNNTQQRQRQRPRRPVNQDMIEVVKTIAPNLTDAQIIYDLEKTGSVSTTVENFLSQGTLPFPPEESNSTASAANNDNNGAAANGVANGNSVNKETHHEPENLIKKYNLESKVNEDYQSKDIRELSLREKKEDMILRARKNLEKELSKGNN